VKRLTGDVRHGVILSTHELDAHLLPETIWIGRPCDRARRALIDDYP
jgi:hypothetical protein